MRHIIGNLDGEADFEATATHRPRRPLATPALAAAASYATLLRGFARPGDVLYLPAAVDPERIPAVAGLTRPKLAVGYRPPTGSVMLAWAETSAVAERRGSAIPITTTTDDKITTLPQRMWAQAPSAASAAARANDRGFGLRIALEAGCLLPGARMVPSLAALREHLATGGAAAGRDGGWVLKAPFGAAARDRHLARDGRPGSDSRLSSLFARHGSLLFEPWMDRTGDFGICMLLSRSGARVASVHRQLMDAGGRLQGIEVEARLGGAVWLSDAEREQLEAVVAHTVKALRGLGYVGPFGIDCWRYRRTDGSTAFQPFGELNARMTIGLAVRALVDRLAPSLGWRPQDRIRVRFGAKLPTGVSLRNAPAWVTQHTVLPLLGPGRKGGGAIWLERLDPRYDRVGSR